LAGSTTKKAVVQRFEREALAGYVNPVSYLQSGGVELLSEQGNVAIVPYAEIKSVAFVREFHDEGPERLVFFTRPKMEGLWVSLRFRDGSRMEGIMANNLLQLEPYGFTVIPPDSLGNRQRVFVPKAALLGIEVLGVVGSPLKRRKEKVASKEQIGLFEE
jgi:hypothetical protein